MASLSLKSIPRTLRSCSATRSISSTVSRFQAASQAPASSTPTHYKITQTRSAIGLGEGKKETLVSLGLHRRMQTVYHPHGPEVAGKVLKVKEIVQVENVTVDQVRTKEEQRQERKADRGYSVQKPAVGGRW